MPTGIMLKSASHEVSEEVRQKNLEAVVEAAGYEVAKEEKEPPAEPKRDDFKTEEEFEAAHVAWQDAQKVPTPEEEEEEIEATPAKKPSRKERAVARATEKLQRENEELRRQLAAKDKEEPAKEQPRPKRADFDTDEKYEDALLAWGVTKAEQEKAVKEAQDSEKARMEGLLGDYGLQLEEAKEEYPDWDELKEKFDKADIFIGHATQLAILEQENGARVTYYLMRHPAYAAKLGKLPQLSAVAEVVRLSDRLKTGTSAPDSSDGEEKPKPKPKVPAPVRTVSTAGSSAALTFAELSAKPNYPGKARDLRALLAKGQG